MTISRALNFLQQFSVEEGRFDHPGMEAQKREYVLAKRLAKEKADRDREMAGQVRAAGVNQPDPHHVQPAVPNRPGTIGQHVDVSFHEPKKNNPEEFKKATTTQKVFVPGERMPGYQFSGTAGQAKYSPVPEPEQHQGGSAPRPATSGSHHEPESGGWGAGVKPLKSSTGNVGHFGQRADTIRAQVLAAQGKPADPNTPYSSLERSGHYYPGGHPALPVHIPTHTIDFSKRGVTDSMFEPVNRGLPSWRGIDTSLPGLEPLSHPYSPLPSGHAALRPGVTSVTYSHGQKGPGYDPALIRRMPSPEEAKAAGHKPTWREEYTPDPREMRYGNWAGNKPEVGVTPGGAHKDPNAPQHVSFQSRRIQMHFDKKTGMLHSKSHRNGQDVQVHHQDVLNKTSHYNDFLRHFPVGTAEIHDDVTRFAHQMSGQKAVAPARQAASRVEPVMHAKPESPAHTTTTSPAPAPAPAHQGTHHEEPVLQVGSRFFHPVSPANMSRAMKIARGFETPEEDAYSTYNAKADKTPKTLSPAMQAMLDRINAKKER